MDRLLLLPLLFLVLLQVQLVGAFSVSFVRSAKALQGEGANISTFVGNTIADMTPAS